MPAVNLLLQRVTHPQRKPYVRSTTFIDGEGPPPFGYFDETQDHIGAFYHGLLGWRYSLDAEDFCTESPHAGYLGRRMLVTKTAGCTAGSDFFLPIYPHYGSWIVSSDTAAFEFEAASAPVTLDGDFLLTARVAVLRLAELGTASLGGFTVAVSNPAFRPVGPGFAAGANSPNWQVVYAPDDRSPAQFADTGIPVATVTSGIAFVDHWDTLQVSRVAGAVRWHVNGQLCRIDGAEGLYFPYRILNGGKYIHAGRNHPGHSGAGFTVDICNLIAERSTL